MRPLGREVGEADQREQRPGPLAMPARVEPRQLGRPVAGPDVTGRKPATTRISVDLPQPLGPTMATNSPAPIESETRRSASTGPLAAA